MIYIYRVIELRLVCGGGVVGIDTSVSISSSCP